MIVDHGAEGTPAVPIAAMRQPFLREVIRLLEALTGQERDYVAEVLASWKDGSFPIDAPVPVARQSQADRALADVLRGAL